MFWKFDLNATSHVDKLLEKEGVTLHELMDQDDILQECKAQNQKLLDFLCRQQCMEELVHLISQDPPLDMEEKVRFKYPNTACELLTSDVPQINDKLGGDETLLNLLYDFLNHEPPLNPLLASFISKTIGNLIARKTEQVIGFLKKKDQFISLVLRHLSTSATMDLLLRLASCVEPASLRQEVLHWLNEEMIIQRLVELVHPGQDEDRQSNASQTLCDIVRLGRDQSGQLQGPSEPDPLLAVLESQGCVEQLLKNMFDGDWTESCLVSGTQVLLTLLETGRAGGLGGRLFSRTRKGTPCQQQRIAWHCATTQGFSPTSAQSTKETSDPDHHRRAGGASGQRPPAQCPPRGCPAAYQHPQHQPGAVPAQHLGPAAGECCRQPAALGLEPTPVCGGITSPHIKVPRAHHSSREGHALARALGEQRAEGCGHVAYCKTELNLELLGVKCPKTAGPGLL